MKRITNYAFAIFALSAGLWFYYSNNEGLARQFPNELLFWEHATQYSGIALLTLILAQLFNERRVEKRKHDLAESGIEYVMKPDGTIVSMRPIR